jgi:mono/diheme cytochrome c family protein
METVRGPVALVLGGLLAVQGWSIPHGAASEKNRLAPTPANIERGKALYASNCARCHGETGKGDGPDATNDLAHRPADLTRMVPDRRFNSDGIVFYKIWNGRTQPEMPAFKSKLASGEVWAIVSYVQTLRRP